MDIHHRGRWRRVAIGSLVLGLTLGACSSDDPESSDESTTTTAADDTTTTKGDGTGSTVGEDAGLTGKGAIDLADSELGEILVQGGGFTIYLTEADTGSESTCVDACAEAWPPLTGDVEVGEGVDEALLGTTTRPDGSEQITYNGHPLYLFSGDTAPGETTGQEVGGVWYVVDAAGNPVDED